MSNFVVGVTGGIGSGKTTVTDLIAQYGVTVVDADVIAREVVAPKSQGLRQIIKHFGKGILLADGTLDRSALRERVFSHPADKTWLDNLLHPLIRKEMAAQTMAASSDYCILSVPLLVENGLQSLVSRVLVVDVPESIQLERAIARDKSNEQIIRAIMQNQCSRKQRLAVADDVVDNSEGKEHLDQQVQMLHEKYLHLASTHK
jgi:dephospho-CoA kinase